MQEKLLLSWSDADGPTRESALCIAVLTNLFDPTELAAEGEDGLSTLQEDIAFGLDSCPGEVRKVTLFRHHPEGVVLVRFVDPQDAAECVRIMGGRWFGGRRVHAELWDGVTMYGAADEGARRREEEGRRLDAFGDWLEGGADA